MRNPDSIARRPNGEFDNDASHPEPTRTLTRSRGGADDGRDWGINRLTYGSRTPWGAADEVEEYAPGITRVGTPGHGGVKLSAQRNAAIHPALRVSGGWYEEDCDAYIPMMRFPQEHVAAYSHWTSNAAEIESAAKASVRNWNPNGYEMATGETILPGQSHERDKQVFQAIHADDYVVTSASSSKDDASMVVVDASLGRRGVEKKRFLVSTDEYDAADRQHGFVVDRARHQEVPIPPAPVNPRDLIPGKAVWYDTSTLAPKEAARANEHLNRRVRDGNGVVSTWAQYYHRNPIRSVSQISSDSGRYHWYAEIADDGSIVQIPAALAKAATVPKQPKP